MSTKRQISLEQYRKTACISAFELVLGLPLDRIKIELQQGEKKIKPTRPYLKYWYAGNVPSLIQRCVIYMPAIKITNSYCDDKPGYIKPFIVAGVISPYVSFFEGIKTAQQKNVWQNTKSNSMTSIIRHIVYEINRPSLLFVSIVPTYLRECCFVGGMIALQPMLYSKLVEYNTFGISTPWSRNFNYTPHHTDNPEFYTPPFCSGSTEVEPACQCALQSTFGSLFAFEQKLRNTFCSLFAFEQKLKREKERCNKNQDYAAFGFKIENTKTDVLPQSKVKLYTALSCLFASLISQTISQPFDVIKTRIELQPTTKVADIFAKLRQNQLHYGWRSVYYAGWLPRVIRGMWTFTCMNYFISFI